MARLVLKFDSAVLKEIPLGFEPVTIGRAPDNDIQIDNLAVSDHHARIFTDNGCPKVQDLGSLNGILLNGSSIKLEWLRTGDVIAIGKHVIVVDLAHGAKQTTEAAKPKVAAPKLDETVVLETRRPEARQRAGDVAVSEETDPPRFKVASLVVLKGRTNHKNYKLSGKLTVIGKSAMATVQLKGWFVPPAAAQVSKRQDAYYLSPVSKRKTKVNGSLVSEATKLIDGDVIEISGVTLKFMYGD